MLSKALRWLPWLMAAVLLSALVLPAPAGVAPEAWRAGAVILLAVVFWGSGALPEHVTSLAFLLIATLAAIAPPEVVFSGFLSQAFWLVLAGGVIGAAVQRTGLGRRISVMVVRRPPADYRANLALVVGVAILLALLMPSAMARILLLVPIILGFAERLGFAPGDKGHTGLILAVVMGSYLGGIGFLPAIVPNVFLTGVASELYGITLTYGRFLLLCLPVLGLLKAGLLILLLAWLFPDQTRRPAGEEAMAPITAEERKLAVILLLALGFWVTDVWHGIAPAWIALAAAVAILTPALGLMPVEAFDREVGFRPLFYVAGLFAVGGLIAETGLSALLGEGMMAVAGLAPDAGTWNYLALSAIATVMGLVGSVVVVPLVLSPIAPDLAAAAGLSLEAILMIEAVGFSTVLLPYTVGPILVGLQIGRVRIADGAKLLLVLAVPTVLLLWPLNYLWWRLLGLLP